MIDRLAGTAFSVAGTGTTRAGLLGFATGALTVRLGRWPTRWSHRLSQST